MMVDAVFRASVITAELLGAYIGTSNADLNAHTRARNSDHSKSIPTDVLQGDTTEWQCDGVLPGVESESSTRCYLKYDDKGEPYFEIDISSSDEERPDTGFFPITNTISGNSGYGVFFYSPQSGKISGDLFCAQGGNVTGNGIRSSNTFNESNALFADQFISDACFDSFINGIKVSTIGADGQEHLVKLRPPNNGQVGIFAFSTNYLGEYFIHFGEPDKEVVLPLSIVQAAQLRNDVNAGSGDHISEDVTNPPLTNILIPLAAIDAFPLTNPPVTTETAPYQEASSTSDQEATASILNDQETEQSAIVMPEVVRSPDRLIGSATITYKIAAEMGENLEIIRLNPNNPDTIALVDKLNEPGWHPTETGKIMASIKSHMSGFGSFKDNLPDWAKGLFGIPAYPNPPTLDSAETGVIHSSITVLQQSLNDDRKSITITGRDTRGDILVFSISGKDSLRLLTPDVTVNGVPDPEMSKEIARLLSTIGKDKTVDHQKPKLASVIAVPNSMPHLSPNPSMNELEHGSGLDLLSLQDIALITSFDFSGPDKSPMPGIAIPVADFPAGFVARYVGTKNGLHIFAVNISDIPSQLSPTLHQTISIANNGNPSGLFLIQVPANAAYSPQLEDLNPPPTPTPSPTPRSSTRPSGMSVRQHSIDTLSALRARQSSFYSLAAQHRRDANILRRNNRA